MPTTTGAQPDPFTLDVREQRPPASIYHEIHGWVEGFAAATGSQPTAETVLVALCWRRPSALWPSIDKQRIVTALASHGVPVPTSPLPADDEWWLGGTSVDVPIDALSRIRRRLLEADLLLGFNTDRENDHAWVHVKDEVAAGRIIAEILDRPDDRPSSA